MSLGENWQSLDAAAQKYGIDRRSLLSWLEEGILRSEVDNEGILLLNIDDLELKIHELTKL